MPRQISGRRVVLLVAPLVFRAPEAPAAREARRPHFALRRASKPARALRSLRRPPHRRRLRCCPGPAAAHRHPGQAPRFAARPCPPLPPAPSAPVGRGVLACGLARRLVVRPGPAADHGYRSLALSTRRPACLKPLSPVLVSAYVGVKPPSPLRAQAELQMKPASPLRMQAELQMKPASPLRVRIGCFWRVFRLHWCCRFQGVLFRGAQW